MCKCFDNGDCDFCQATHFAYEDSFEAQMQPYIDMEESMIKQGNKYAVELLAAPYFEELEEVEDFYFEIEEQYHKKFGFPVYEHTEEVPF
jgi:hypothetical protein